MARLSGKYWHTEIRAFGGSLAEATVPPGTTTQAHYHLVSEEIYYILQGSGVVGLGAEEREVAPGDGIAIPPGVVHEIHNPGGENLVFMCCCAPGYEHQDTIWSIFSRWFRINDDGRGISRDSTPISIVRSVRRPERLPY